MYVLNSKIRALVLAAFATMVVTPAILFGAATSIPGKVSLPPTIQRFGATGGTLGQIFTITSASPVAGDVYHDSNTVHFTILQGGSSITRVFTSADSITTPAGSTLTKDSGSGPSTLTFSASQPLAIYTKPSAARWLRVRQIAGGGGGGGSGTTSTGGTGGSGGTTAFGVNILLCTGGTGGASIFNGNPGAGGAASIGTAIGFALSGGSGTGATDVSTSFSIGGIGSASPFGGAGGSQPSAGINAVTNTGSGGGGAGMSVTAGYAGTGGGAGGYVDAVISSPASTYYYAVGTGGAAGTAGTSGGAGGTGGSGVIIVEEYY